MTETAKLERPRQVTLAAFLIMGGSALVLVTVFERIAGLNDLETREAVESFLAEPPGNGLGLDVPRTLTLLQGISTVAGVCAAVALVLGYHVLKRHRGARLGLSILALPLFLTGLVAGGFLSSMVAAAAAMLWMTPARDWFDGVEPRRRPEPAQPAPSDPMVPPPPSAPRPHTGFGAVPAPAPGAGGDVGARPDQVLWACVLTWTLSGLAALMMGVSALVIAVRPGLVLDEVRRQNPELASQGVSAETIEVATYVTAGVVIAWALLAILLALLVHRRSRAARVGLIGSASAAAAVSLMASAGSLVMVVPLAGAVATVWLLLRPEVRAWFRGP